MKFKVGDYVKAKPEVDNDIRQSEGVIVSIDSDSVGMNMEIKITKSGGYYKVGEKTIHSNWGDYIELMPIKYKPKKPTHLVTWDIKGCGDPTKFFTSEKDAKEFVKDLSERVNVVKDSIIFVEIKSSKKMTISKSLKYKEHKI